MDLDALARDLDFVKSRLEIHDCIVRYARGQDRFDADMTTSAFHPDAVLDFGVFVGNPNDFVAYFYDLHERFHHRHSHIMCNHVCELDGDTAHTETYFIVTSRNREGPPFHMGGGRYIDRFERRNGHWAIATRKCIAEWNANEGVELTGKLSSIYTDVGTVSRDRTDASYQRPSTIAPERIGINIPV